MKQHVMIRYVTYNDCTINLATSTLVKLMGQILQTHYYYCQHILISMLYLDVTTITGKVKRCDEYRNKPWISFTL